ncbi:MAG: hypothetical protein ACKPKO_27375, partial [Candidatus Fonsibacter sp.]
MPDVEAVRGAAADTARRDVPTQLIWGLIAMEPNPSSRFHSNPNRAVEAEGETQPHKSPYHCSLDGGQPP